VLAFVLVVVGSDIGRATGLSGAVSGLWAFLQPQPQVRPRLTVEHDPASRPLLVVCATNQSA
jgi:hypothetical protein